MRFPCGHQIDLLEKHTEIAHKVLPSNKQSVKFALTAVHASESIRMIHTSKSAKAGNKKLQNIG